MKSTNHKLNRAVQAMLFGMVEKGMGGEVAGDKGKTRAAPTGDASTHGGDDAMWAIILTKELWRKGVWCVAVHILPTVCSLKDRTGQTRSLFQLLL